MYDDDLYGDDGIALPRPVRNATWTSPSSSRDKIHGDTTGERS